MNCCNEYGDCKQGNGCPVRCTPLSQLCGAEHIDLTGLSSELPQPTFIGEPEEFPSSWQQIGDVFKSLGIALLLVGGAGVAANLLILAITSRVA